MTETKETEDDLIALKESFDRLLSEAGNKISLEALRAFCNYVIAQAEDEKWVIEPFEQTA